MISNIKLDMELFVASPLHHLKEPHLRDKEGSSHQDQGDTNHHASAQRGWCSLKTAAGLSHGFS